MADTVKSRACIFSVSQSTFLRVFMKMTACVMVRVSYKSHSVSSFHSWEGGGETSQGLYPTHPRRPASGPGPHLSLHVDVELADTLQGQLLLLDQDPDGVPHELLGHLEHVGRHRGGQQNHLTGKSGLGGGPSTMPAPRSRPRSIPPSTPQSTENSSAPVIHVSRTWVLLLSFWNMS